MATCLLQNRQNLKNLISQQVPSVQLIMNLTSGEINHKMEGADALLSLHGTQYVAVRDRMSETYSQGS